MKSSRLIFNIALLIIFISVRAAFPQADNLKTKISSIIKQTKGNVGVAVIGFDNHDTVIINNNLKYPMQSVYKFPLALYILRKVDEGKLSLDQKIHLTKENLLPNTWSPLRKKYPNANVDVELREILSYTIRESDNNGCDILFKLVGGTAKVNKYIHSLGIKGMSIAATEKEMHSAWNVQYKNYSSPLAMGKLFCKFALENILSSASKNFLLNLLTKNDLGSNRIPAQLPAGTIVAHKTGTSDVNDKGIAAAANDAGIVTLPNGDHFVIVVFVSDSPDNEISRNKLIADIAKAAWDSFTKKQ